MENMNFKINNNIKKALEKEYVKALLDDDFKKIVDTLKMPDETLMKYTSQLEEATCNFKNCMNCKGLHECKNEIIGHAYLPIIVNNELHFAYRACKYKSKHNKENAFHNNTKYYHVSEDIKAADIKKIYKEDKNRYPAIKWLSNFIKNYDEIEKGLFLHGSFGSGKTYLISATFNELAKKGFKTMIIYFPEFLRSLKAAFSTKDYGLIFQEVQKCELLLIDDLGAETNTNWSRDEILGPILQYRMENHLKTFVTSNLNIEQLEEHFSVNNTNVDLVKARRITSRIKTLMDDIELISVSIRK